MGGQVMHELWLRTEELAEAPTGELRKPGRLALGEVASSEEPQRAS